MTFNERLKKLRSRKLILRQKYVETVYAFDEALERKGGPGPNVWDDEMAMLSQKRREAHHALELLDAERDRLISEAHTAVAKIVREIGADKIVSTNGTFLDALEF